MKKFIILILTISMLIMPLSVSAEVSSGLSTSYSTNESGNIVVYAGVVNINDPSGLCGLSYDIVYDNQVLEIVDVNVVIPEKWQPFVESEMVENWSAPKSANVYSWALFNCEIGNGIKNDHELCIRIEFKPISKTSTSIQFLCENVINDNVVELAGESKLLNIEFDNTTVSEPQPESKPEDSKPIESQPVESEVESSEVVESSDVDDSDVVSSEEESQSVTENNSENSSSIENIEYDEKSDMGIAIGESAADNNGTDETTNQNVVNRKIIFVLCIVGAVAIIAIVVFVAKKGKK